VTLSDLGMFGNGILDPWKDMHELGGSVAFAAGTGKDIRMYVWTAAGVFLPVKAMGLRWDY